MTFEGAVIGRDHEPALLVILSGGSSGSHLLARLLAGYGPVRTGPELALFHHGELFNDDNYPVALYRGLTDRGSVMTRETSTGQPFDLVPRRLIFNRDFYGCATPEAELELITTTDNINELAIAVFERCVEQHGWERDAVMIEHTPMSSLWADRIVDAFPTARFVHLVRDVRDAVASMAVRRRLGVFKGLPLAENVRLSAEQWCLLNSCARLAETAGTRYSRVRYEDLVRRPDEVVEMLLRHIGVSADVRTPEQNEPDATHIRHQRGWGIDPNGEVSARSIGRYRHVLPAGHAEELLSLEFGPLRGIDVSAPATLQDAYGYQYVSEAECV